MSEPDHIARNRRCNLRSWLALSLAIEEAAVAVLSDGAAMTP